MEWSALAQIGDRLGVSDAAAPPMTFVNRETGAEVTWAFIDQKTGEQVRPSDIEIREGPGSGELVHWRLAHGRHRRGDQTDGKTDSKRTDDVASAG